MTLSTPAPDSAGSSNLTEILAKYAAYHRDERNVVTHFIGIPMILISVLALLARPAELFDWPVSLAVVAALAVMAYYFTLDLRFGAVMAAFLGLCLLGGEYLADQSRLVFLVSALGLLIAGWAFQFVGHYLEGEKPAFLDDVKSLLVGPLFLAAEAAFGLGLRGKLKDAVDARADVIAAELKAAGAAV